MYVTDLRLSNWIIAHDKALGFFFVIISINYALFGYRNLFVIYSKLFYTLFEHC